MADLAANGVFLETHVFCLVDRYVQKACFKKNSMRIMSNIVCLVVHLIYKYSKGTIQDEIF